MIDHEARKKSIGASEIASILGHNEYTTPYDVWMVKTGRREPFEGNEATRRGQRQELSILSWFHEQTESEFHIMATDLPTQKSEIEPLATATPDAIVSNGHLRQGVEAKSTLKRIKEIDEIPIMWIVQCQWGMYVTGLKTWNLVIHGPMVSDYQYFPIQYNEPFATEIVTQAVEWWDRHIIKDVAPDPMNTADVFSRWPQDNGETIEAVPAVHNAILMYNDIKAKIKALEAAKDALKDQITPAIGEAQIVTYGGKKIASFKTQVSNHSAKEAKTVTSRVFRT